ncbi:hypothetical protein [Nostoc sp. ChiQUE01b]|nr:hypothetical protein [Nostoc sp. ChiQUE01b]MDZ8259637.1 hypothetical protein [Nostoc sp. ChiQUE01b]
MSSKKRCYVNDWLRSLRRRQWQMRAIRKTLKIAHQEHLRDI